MSSTIIPPGQTLTKKFPVTGEKQASRHLTEDNWSLSISGEVEETRTLNLGALLSLQQSEFEADIHCVTSWSQLGMAFEGVKLATLVNELVDPKPCARFVRFVAYSDRKHDTSLPIEVAMKDCWLVHGYNGKALAPEHGYPVRVVTPSRYFYKSLKWLKEIVFLAEDQLGFWERTSGYHNVGDPWFEQRLEGHRFTSQAEVTRFRNLIDFSAYQKESPESVIVKANLRDWRPRTKDLHGLQLKACDFRGADLSGANLKGANLTLGNFEGVNLEDADLSRADLEGANFSGAYLAGALFQDNLLSAAVFWESYGLSLASYQGLRVVRPQGLFEEQSDYIKNVIEK